VRRIAAGAALVLVAVAAAGLLFVLTRPPSDPGPEHAHPIVIAHRGASGYRPEHTLAAYELAIEQGADFIEPDLVSTRDGVLVARHENEFGGTTDVSAHPEFADRRVTKVIDGQSVTGWFTEDFTLEELGTLRARERIPQLRPQNAGYDDEFGIPTFEEVVDLARRESAARGRTIGVYPETKHPGYFDSIALSLEGPLVEILERSGYRDASAPVFIQSFEGDSLRELATLTGVRLIQLVAKDAGPLDLAGIAVHAQGIGVEKDLVIPRDGAGRLAEPTALVRDAHDHGLLVHAWTFRAENAFLPSDLRHGDQADPLFLASPGDLAAEIDAFRAAGIDGLFVDQPDIAVAAFDR
jgi:glycerophosphoryl diester phosphodiesterase